MRRFLLFVSLLFVLLFPTIASAHMVGQPPFLKVNGKYAGFYNVPILSEFFVIPQDQSPENYVVKQEISFEIDPVALQYPLDALKHSTFSWEFGDGTKGTGLNNVHTYTSPGSYVLNIMFKYENDDAQLIESDILQILPTAEYVLPKAEIRVNGHVVTDTLGDIQKLPFSSDTAFEVVSHDSTSPTTYSWDMGDHTQSSALSVVRSYPAAMQQAYPILRAKDSLGFYTDTYVQLENTEFKGGAGSATPKPSPSSSTNYVFTPQRVQQQPGSSSFFSVIGVRISQLTTKIFSQVLESNLHQPLLFALALVLLFVAGGLHALTPGHGKSMMTAFLVGKKGSKAADILLLALSITVTHTAVIFILGFVFLFLDQTHTLTDVLPYFEKGGAILVIILAVRLILNGIHHLRHQYQHEHHHEHDHEHHHDHVHAIEANGLGKRTILFAGFSGGIVPCTDAFALLLLLATAGKVLLGMLFVLVFSVGLATTIVALGLFIVLGKKSFSIEQKLERVADTYLPIISGIILFVIAAKLLIK